MARLNGTDMLVIVDSVVVGHGTNFNLDIEATEVNVTDQNSNSWEEILSGTKRWSVESTGWVDYTGSYPVGEQFDALDSGTNVTLRVSTQQTGDTYFEGSAKVMRHNQSGGIDTPVSFTTFFKGTGSLTKATE